MVVREVAGEDSSQVGFVEYDEMREALSADTAVQALNVRILPWRSWCYYDFVDAHVLDPAAEELAVNGVRSRSRKRGAESSGNASVTC